MDTEELILREYASVVIIDDNKINRDAFKAYIKRLNPETKIKTYNDGKEFLETRTVVRSLADINLMLLDRHMPYFDGFNFLDQLKENYEYIPPVVMVTADIFINPSIIDLYSPFLKRIVTKPIDSRVLNPIIEQYLK